MLNYKFAYLLGVLIYLPTWLALYWYRKDLRKKILLISCCVGLLAVFWSPWFLVDYWNPEFVFRFSFFKVYFGGVEDLAYGFFIGGIACSIYEEVFRKKSTERHDRKHNWPYLVICLASLFLITFFLGYGAGLNSIYAAFFTFLIGGLFILFFRSDLWQDAIMSGVLVGIITLLAYFIFLWIFPGVVNSWWRLSNLSGVLFYGIPVEELIWAFGLGAVAGPLYEFSFGIKLKDIK